jgi:hypothetical protein
MVHLRTAALSLRLTLFATSLTAQKPETTSESREPTLIRLSKGEVQLRTSSLMCDILPRLKNDPNIDFKQCVLRLLVTQAHIIIRFNQYREYPAKIWKLSKKYNPTLYTSDIISFINEPADNLDYGFSKPLQEEAWDISDQNESKAVEYLRGKEIQDELDAFIEGVSGTTLEIERKHNQDKQGSHRLA